MDAQEKLTALKKAYADVILNISKEAAARVMASERRAVQYQHELNVAKDEALRMLMRLKQMMDFKIGEADAASLNRQNKIEELEAQLQEAEDIVRDLREELRELQGELERVKKDDFQHVDEADKFYPREELGENMTNAYQPSKFLHPESRDEVTVASDVTMLNIDRRDECRKCCNKIVCMCSSYLRDRDLPSIILKSKKPGLYRNGRAQRIRACERNLADCGLSLSEQTDRAKDKIDEEEHEEGEDTGKTPAPGAKPPRHPENELLADKKLSRSGSLTRKRKRASKRKKTRSSPVSVKAFGHSGGKRSRIAPTLPPDNAGPQTHMAFTESSEKEKLLVENEEMVPIPDEIANFGMSSNDMESKLVGTNIKGQSAGGRVIKYTFQRKRKTPALTGSEVNASLETEKRTVQDVQNAVQKVDHAKSRSVVESSRDSRRLAQVARQLISLSEKKWWQ